MMTTDTENSSIEQTLKNVPLDIIEDCLEQIGVSAAVASKEQWCTALVNAASGLSGIGPTQSKAIRLYETVLQIDPSHREAIFALGIVYSDHGKTDELIRLYRQRISSTEDSGEKATLHMYIAETCLLYTSPSPRDATLSRMPSSA